MCSSCGCCRSSTRSRLQRWSDHACVLPLSSLFPLSSIRRDSWSYPARNIQKEQVRSIEQTKLTLKKRKGVVPFVRIFPVRPLAFLPNVLLPPPSSHLPLPLSQLFVARVENQLGHCDGLNIRGIVNAQYERIVETMFDCLQQMAKMDGEGQGQGGEGKDQLNYHVILIGASTFFDLLSRHYR